MFNGKKLASAALGLTTLCVVTHASTPLNGWNYAIDSQNDGSGGLAYEYRGLAYTVKDGKMIFAVSGEMALGGIANANARNGRVSHGDLFINMGNGNLDAQSKFNSPDVLAVRFDISNDSLENLQYLDGNLGVFGSVQAVSYTTQNVGYSTLAAYKNAGFGRNTDAMADLEDTDGDVKNYLGHGTMFPNIERGTKLAGLNLLNRAELLQAGVDFGAFGADPAGNELFGFFFDASIVGGRTFTAHLFEECINDGMAIHSAVPEPGTMVGLALGISALLRRRRK